MRRQVVADLPHGLDRPRVHPARRPGAGAVRLDRVRRRACGRTPRPSGCGWCSRRRRTGPASCCAHDASSGSGLSSRAPRRAGDDDRRQQRPERRGGQVHPQVFELAADHGRGQRPGRVHRRPADRPGEQRLQGDHRPDGDAGHDALLLRPGRDAEDHEHQDQGQDDLERRTTATTPPGRQRRPERRRAPGTAAAGQRSRRTPRRTGRRCTGTTRRGREPAGDHERRA